MKSPTPKIVATIVAVLALAFVAAAVGHWIGRPSPPADGAVAGKDEAAKAASRAMTFTQPEQPSK